MDIRTLAALTADVQSSLLLVLSLLCCFGVIHFLCKKYLPILRRGGLLLAGGATALLWPVLFYRPVFIFVPILLFVLVCTLTGENQG